MASVAAERHQRELGHFQGCCSAECAAAEADLGRGGEGKEEVCAHSVASNEELIRKIVFIATSHADNRIVHVEIDFYSAPSIKAAAHAQDKRRIIHLKIIANVIT